ncbi:MAG: hypothetical protein KKA36_06040, partial [Gammaproteobacteria bacterium]|nr:hypothetical protein [Gammaproteobacteria bacterium]
MRNNIEATETPAVTLRRIESSLDLLRLHERNPERYPHLLESAAPGQQANFDILFAFPEHSLKLTADMQLAGSEGDNRDFLAALDKAWQTESMGQSETHTTLPFRGGWFLYLGYELAAQIEPRLQLPASTTQQPIA